jgi:hypothetical protein
MTESTQRDESVRAKIAQIDHLNQAPVIKVIKYGNELIKVNLSVKILKLGLDVHYRQVTVAMQEDGWLVRPVGKMGYREFLKWIKKKLAQGWQIYSCYEAGAGLADLQLLRSRRQWVLVRPQAPKAWSGQPGGGAQSDGPRGKEAKDRSARQLSIDR